MSDYWIATDGYGDLAIWRDDIVLIRKCDLPPKTRDDVWDLLVDATGAEEVQPCAAVVYRGNRWGDTPEPDEMCERDALPGAEFCEQHTDPEDY